MAKANTLKANDTFKEVSQREEAKKTVKKALEERYTSGKNRWFFTPLSKFDCYCLWAGNKPLLMQLQGFKWRFGVERIALPFPPTESREIRR